MEELIRLAQTYDQIRMGVEQTVAQWQRLLVEGDYTPERLQAQAECLTILAELAAAGAGAARAIGEGLPGVRLAAELTLARAERRRSYWTMTLFSPRNAHLVDLSAGERESMWKQARDIYIGDTERVRDLERQLRELGVDRNRSASPSKSPRR